MVARTDNPSTEEEETGESEVQAQTRPHSKFKTTLAYVRSCQPEREGREKEAKRDEEMRRKLPAEGASTAQLERWRQHAEAWVVWK